MVVEQRGIADFVVKFSEKEIEVLKTIGKERKMSMGELIFAFLTCGIQDYFNNT